MSIAIILYLIGLIEDIKILGIISIIFILVLNFILWADNNFRLPPAWIFFRKSLYGILPIILLVVILPSKNTTYLMLDAAYLQSSNIPQKVQNVIELELDNVIADLKKDKEPR